MTTPRTIHEKHKAKLQLNMQLRNATHKRFFRIDTWVGFRLDVRLGRRDETIGAPADRATTMTKSLSLLSNKSTHRWTHRLRVGVLTTMHSILSKPWPTDPTPQRTFAIHLLALCVGSFSHPFWKSCWHAQNLMAGFCLFVHFVC